MSPPCANSAFPSAPCATLGDGRPPATREAPASLRARLNKRGVDDNVFSTFRTLAGQPRSEEHTSELQSRENIVCRLLLEKKNRIEHIEKNKTTFCITNDYML